MKDMQAKKPNLIEAAMKHRQVVIILVVLLNIAGLYALLHMPRTEFPEFTVRQGIVAGIYPGATSAQVEEQLATKLENYLFSFAEINKAKTYSQSKEGQVVMMVELNESVSNPDQFWSKLRLGLQEQRGSFPPGAMIVTNTDFGSTAALLLTVESKDKTYKELETVYLKQLETGLRRLPSLSKISHIGLLSEQITVDVDARKLTAYGIKPGLLLQALKAEGSTDYAGELDEQHLLLPIHLGTRYHTENDLAEQIVYTDPQGTVVRLKDVATLRREYAEPSSYIQNNGTRALVVTVEMAPGHNIVEFGEEVDHALAKVTKNFPADVTIHKVVNQPEVVDESISHFLKEFGLAIGSVILVTLLLLPFRVAAVAGLTIPISILITLAVMNFAGIELNTVTLAALIIVLGMVVDNAIVVIDNHVEKLDHGDSPWHAAWKSATELVVPVTVATLAITASFFPLSMFLGGTAKDFLGAFPITIAIALGASMFVALLLVPYLDFLFIKKGLHNHEAQAAPRRKSLLDYVQAGYDKGLDTGFRFPFFTVVLGVLSIVAGVMFAGGLPQELFPSVERNQFAVEIYLPAGHPLKETAQVSQQVTELLRKDKRVTSVTSFTGSSSPRFHTTYAPQTPAKNYAQLVVNTASAEATETLLEDYTKKYRNYFPNAYVRFKQLDMLEAAAPIEVRVIGDSIPAMRRVADQVIQRLRQQPGISWVRTDYGEPRQGIRVQLKEDEATRLGFTQSNIAQALALGVSSVPVTTVWEGDYPVAVQLETQKDQRNDYAALANTSITSPKTFATVPLRQVADLVPTWQEEQIVRRNGVRTLTVRADLERHQVASNVLSKVMPDLDKLALPEGVDVISYGGEHSQSLENQGPMALSLGVAVVSIFLILLFQFRNAKTAGLIMLTMPLSLFGAAFGLELMDYAFGFTSFMGLLSLCGIVVRNGIILIDYAQELRRDHGMTVAQAAEAAGKRRMRPIFLTSAAAAIGVVPMIISRSPLWGPLGTVICFGLLFSMVLTLFVLPVLYWLFFRGEDQPEALAEHQHELEEEQDNPTAVPAMAGSH
jgi:multidrug efflux pump subunit AcrB